MGTDTKGAALKPTKAYCPICKVRRDHRDVHRAAKLLVTLVLKRLADGGVVKDPFTENAGFMLEMKRRPYGGKIDGDGTSR